MIVELGELDGTNGFRLDGASHGDFAGRSVSTAGDVNSDGIADLIVGAPFASNFSGAGYVVFGRASGFAASLELQTLDGIGGFRLDGPLGAENGHSVSDAGDVNGDGIDDLIVGAPYANNFSGASYIVFGSAAGFAPSVHLAALDGTDGFRLEGAAIEDFSGYSVSGAGDVNGDGIYDLIIGAPSANTVGGEIAGSSYVVFGSAAGFAPSLDLAALDGTDGFRLDGAAFGDFSGYSVSGAGDVNGDGFDDVIVGAPFAETAAGSHAGSSYVVFGGDDGFPASLEIAALDGTDGFHLDSAEPRSYSGNSVSAAGDVNGDGIDDLIVGAPGYTYDLGYVPGSSYVVFGRDAGFPASLDLAALDGSDGFRIDGPPHSESGRSVAGAGDVNGDGIDDLIIGAPGYYFQDSGSAYVVFGSDAGFAASLDLTALDDSEGFRIVGAASEHAGFAVSAAGDVNGDSLDDLIVGAPYAYTAGLGYAGTGYVVFGFRTGDTCPTEAAAAAGLDDTEQTRGALASDHLDAAALAWRDFLLG